MPSLREIVYEITDLNDSSIDRWIVNGLTSLTPEMLETAIFEWQDPLLLAEYLNLENPAIKFVAKTVLKKYWERVEHVLTDPWELYNQISKDKRKKELLDTERGRAWLTYVRKKCYDYYFNYTWN